MKIAHISDIHWRSITRHAEYTDSFNRLFDMFQTIKPDLIINTGDTYHTKVQGITPEVVDKLSWMFKKSADIAPTITLLGNHDGNLTNMDRQDTISPIHEAVAHPRSFLSKKSISKPGSELGVNPYFVFHIFSPFDADGWSHLKPQPGKINIALFHGALIGCETDGNYKMMKTDTDVSFFKGMDFVLLGDIHKQQFLAYRPNKANQAKPWIGYAGSLIQQNFGELEKKGFLLWDINDTNDWNVEFVELENKMPFVTVPWVNSVTETLQYIQDTREERAFLPGTRFRITSNSFIPQVEVTQLVNELKEHKGASDVFVMTNATSKVDTIEVGEHHILKTNLRNSPETLVKFFNDYVNAHKDIHELTPAQMDKAEKQIQLYLDRLNIEEAELPARNVTWALKTLEFSNTFRYGENNKINFENLKGLVGIFGPNRVGKSAIVGTLTYGLYNTTDRGPIKNAFIINRAKKSCSAKIGINVNNVDYFIERETIKSNSKQKKTVAEDDKSVTSLNFYKTKPDGTKVELNSVTRDDTDKEVRKLIGSSQDFLLTAFASQGGINKFIEEGATQRKAILSRFSDLDIFEKLFAYAKNDASFLGEKTKKYSSLDWDNAINRLQEEADQFDRESGMEEEKLKEISLEIDALKLWVHQNEQQGMDLEKHDILQKQIQRLSAHIQDLKIQNNNCAATLETLVSKQADLVSQKEKFDITSLQSKLDELEALKTNVSNIKESFHKESAVLEQQRKSIKKLETVPCGNQYPTCRFIKDSHEDKQKIAEQEHMVSQLVTQVATIESAIQALVADKISEKLKDYDRLVFEEKTIEHKIEAITSLSTMRQKELELAANELSDKEAEFKRLENIVSSSEQKELDAKRNRLKEALAEAEEFREKHRQLIMQLGSKKEQLKQLQSELDLYKLETDKLKIFEAVQAAFSKTGIPAILLKTQMPAINAELSKILGGIVDFKVILEADVASNAMDVYIEDGHSRRVIELASGMEKMISSLALRVALINLSNLPKPDVFIIDEGFGNLDEHGLGKCMELLSVIKAYFKTVIVITHINPIKEIADQIIEIKNIGGIESKVETP